MYAWVGSAFYVSRAAVAIQGLQSLTRTCTVWIPHLVSALSLGAAETAYCKGYVCSPGPLRLRARWNRIRE